MISEFDRGARHERELVVATIREIAADLRRKAAVNCEFGGDEGALLLAAHAYDDLAKHLARGDHDPEVDHGPIS
jgi:hypothetical protein